MCQTILLVDDDPVQGATRKAILASAGNTVFIVKEPREGLGILQDSELLQKLSLVITDHIMPGMNGPQFVTELRKLLPDVPVLVLSGMPDVEPEYNGLNVLFRLKPLAPLELIQLTRFMTGSQLSRTA
jgi:CheY-like chemotaxis protein